MSEGQTDYKAFRGRLDAVLRQRDPAKLREFLVAEEQWQQSASTNEEAAMWMMIAASPALRDLHDEAKRWLIANGHEAEAQAILGRRGGGGGSGGGHGAGRSTQTRAPSDGQRRAHHAPSPARRPDVTPPARGQSHGRHPRDPKAE